MIIRIGDEKRDCRDDHLRKLKQQIQSEEAQKNLKGFTIETLVKCITHLPHKTMLYCSLIGLIAVENESFA
jgi:hypothetical protein